MSKNRRKILFVSVFAHGGAYEDVLNHLDFAADYFDETHLVFAPYGKAEFSCTKDCFCHRIKLPDLRKIFFQPYLQLIINKEFTHIIKKVQPDVVLLFASQLGSVFAQICRAQNIPTINFVLGIMEYRAKNFAEHYYEVATKNSTYMAFVSRAVLSKFEKYYRIPVSNDIVIPSAINIEDFVPRSSISFEENNILAVGRLERNKLFDLILHAFAIIHATDSRKILNIIGYGSCETELKALCKTLDIDNNVVFHGKIPLSELPEFYRKANFTLHACDFEGFGRVIIESLACGTPVISASSGGPEEILAEERGGFIVPFSADAIAEKAKLLCQNRVLRASLADDGRKNVVQNFSREHIAQVMSVLYNSLL